MPGKPSEEIKAVFSFLKAKRAKEKALRASLKQTIEHSLILDEVRRYVDRHRIPSDNTVYLPDVTHTMKVSAGPYTLVMRDGGFDLYLGDKVCWKIEGWAVDNHIAFVNKALKKTGLDLLNLEESKIEKAGTLLFSVLVLAVANHWYVEHANTVGTARYEVLSDVFENYTWSVVQMAFSVFTNDFTRLTSSNSLYELSRWTTIQEILFNMREDFLESMRVLEGMNRIPSSVDAQGQHFVSAGDTI